MAAFLAILGGAYYFTLMKNTVSIEYQSSVVASAVYCFMAAVIYAYINYKYGVGSDALKMDIIQQCFVKSIGLSQHR